MKKILLTAASLTILSSPYVSASATLTEALVHTYNNNPSLLHERENLRATDEKMFEAISGFLPNISFTNKNIFSKGNTASRTFIDKDGEIQSGTISKKPWARTRSRENSLTLKQNLFNGGGTLAAVEVARYTIQQGRENLRKKEQEVLLSAIDTYMSVLQARKEVEINKKNVSGFKQRYEAVKDRLDAGIETRTALAQAEFKLSSSILSLAGAENNYAGAIASYQSVIGLDADNLDEPANDIEIPKNLDDALSLAFKNHPELAAAQAESIAADYNAKHAFSKLMPEVDFQASMSESKSKTDGRETPRRDEKSLGIVVNVPIYSSGLKYSQIRKAKSAHRGSKVRVNSVKNHVQEKAIQAWNAYQTTFTQLNHAQTAVRAATIALDGKQHEYKEGVATLTDLLEAQSEQFEANKQLLKAEKERLASIYQLKAVIGQLDAKSLNLPTPVYDPTTHYDEVKFKLIGF